MSEPKVTEVDVIHGWDTEKAVQLKSVQTGVEKWVPKSQVELHGCSGPDQSGIAVMPVWLAKEKGFV